MSKLAAALAIALMAGCASSEMCELLAIALDEADMAEAWYIETGAVLSSRCGVVGADAVAERKACYARRFNDSSVECKP